MSILLSKRDGLMWNMINEELHICCELYLSNSMILITIVIVFKMASQTQKHACICAQTRCRENVEQIWKKKLTEESMKMSNRIVALNSENCITHSIDIGRN